ncbi:MAG: TonB-dependent receptor domain-containing protein [Gemmatimonadaceae bacterium]
MAASPLAAQGTVVGLVTLAGSGTPIESAIVQVIGTNRGALSGAEGSFRISGIAPGRYTVEVRALGHTIERHAVVVRDGLESSISVRLAAAPRELAGVTVVGAAADALSRIPGAATAIEERQLRAHLPLSANEVLRTVPGIHVQEEEGAGLRANIGIRGLDPDRSRSVLVLEDGIPVSLAPYGEPEMYYSPPIDRMSRIEIIKGSGSILFGPQTIGGVVNYVTAEPATGAAGRAELRGGTGDQRFAKLMLSGSRGPTRGLVSAFQRQALDLNGLDYVVQDVTAKAGVRTGFGDISAKVSIYDEASNSTYVGLTDSLFRASPSAHPMPDDRLAIARQAGSIAHETPFGGATVRTTAYAYHTSRDWTRRDYTYGPSGGTIVPGTGAGSRNRSFDVSGIEPRLRTLWTVAGVTSDLDVGARYHRERARDRFLTGTADGSTTGVRDDEVRSGEAVSAWVQNRFALTPRFHLTPGLRAERFRFERHITRGRVRRDDGATVTRQVEDLDIRSADAVGELIPGLGATWTPGALVTVFAGAHRGFAPPRAKDALIYGDPTLAPDQQVPDPVSLQLDAERSWNYELGARLAPRPFLSLEMTAFVLDFSNQIIEPSLSAGSAAAAALANQGATRHEGVELGGSLDLGMLLGRPFTLALEGNYTLALATFSRDRFVERGGDTVNLRGNSLPYAPVHRAHAAVTFEHGRGVRARVDGSFIGAQFSDNFETIAGSANGRAGRIPAYRVFDASLQYDIPGLSGVQATGSVKNIAGSSYIASRRPEGIKVGTPRLVSLGVAWDF